MPVPVRKIVERQPALGSLAALAEQAVATRRGAEPYPHGEVPLEQAETVVLICSRPGRHDFYWQTYLQELATMAELAKRGVPYATTEEPARLFGKRILWGHPSELVRPVLWNHARQVEEFVRGLESQDNRCFVSSAEARYWENKSYMHAQLDAIGAATPRTVVVTEADRETFALDFEPVIVKLEHSAGSEGIHYFDDAGAARAFVAAYAFRPTESLIVQEPVLGATRDLRLTMVGDRAIASATYWRTKSADALAASEWTTTATTHGSTVAHEPPPPAAVTACAEIMRKLGMRTAGIDLMWRDDDVDGAPLMLELSPIYQPNPPKPAAHAHRTYKEFKSRRYLRDGYARGQYEAWRAIAGAILDQDLL